MADYIEVQPDRASFAQLAAALMDEADGREWRSDVGSALRQALQPGVQAVRSQILTRGGSGKPHEGQSLRGAIAGAVRVESLRSGAPGATIAVGKSGMPRGFHNAPKRFNQTAFRHPVYGRDAWASQRGAPGWFDDPLNDMRPALEVRVQAALDNRAERVARNGPR